MLKFIHTHYSDQIALKEIADAVNIKLPISAVFRQQVTSEKYFAEKQE